MTQPERQPDPAQAAFDDVRAVPGIVGVARDADDQLIFLLDRDEPGARDAVVRWGEENAVIVTIKIVGGIVT